MNVGRPSARRAGFLAVSSDFASLTPEALRRDSAWLHAVAVRLVGDPFRADDLVQETWLAALRQPSAERRSAREWLAGVVRNLALLNRRATLRRERREARAPAHRSASAADLADQADLHRRLLTAILDLDEPFRSTVLLRYYGDRTAEEIAREEGCPSATVRTRLKRGLDRLREKLSDRDRAAWRAAIVALPPGTLSGWSGAAAETGGAGSIAGAAGGSGAAGAAKAAAAVLLIAAASGAWLLRSADPPRSTAEVRDRTPAVAPAPDSGSSSGDVPPIAAERRLPAGEPGWITGIVLAPDGRPVAGARVVVAPAALREAVPEPGPGATAPGAAATRSGADGIFRVEPPGAGETFTLLADDPSAAPARLDARAGAFHEVRLPPARRATGFVRADGGRPVADARVLWTAFLDGFTVRREARTDSGGAYVLEALPDRLPQSPASFATVPFVTVEAVGFAPTRTDWAPEAAPGGAERQDLLVATPATLRGRVTDAEDGRPVAGAAVRVWSGRPLSVAFGPAGQHLRDPHRPWIGGTATTDGHGEFEVAGLPAAGPDGAGTLPRPPWSVAVTAPGHAPELRTVVPAGDGGWPALDVALRKPARFTGRVFDGHGNPAAGARIQLRHGGARLEALGLGAILGARDPTVVADGDGRYAVSEPWLVPGERRDVRVQARAERSPWEHGASVAVAAEGSEDFEVQDLVLPALAEVQVEVVDGHGRGVAGAAVGTAPLGESGSDRETWITDAAGTTRLLLAPEVIRSRGLRLFADVPGLARGDSGPLAAPPAEGEAVRIVLGNVRTLRGRVAHADGSAAEAVQIWAVHDGIPGDARESAAEWMRARLARPESVAGSATSGPDGRFVLRGVPAAPVTVVAIRGRDGACSAPVRIGPDEAPADLDLGIPGAAPPPPGPSGTVTVVVADDASGRPLPWADVRIAGADPSAAHFAAVGPGVFTFAGLPPGASEARVHCDGFIDAAARAVVDPDAPAPVIEVRLAAAPRLQGRVAAPDGRAFSEARAYFVPIGGGRIVQAAVTADGSFALAGLESGRTYRATVRDRTPAGDRFWVAAGGARTLAPGDGAPAAPLTIPLGAGGILGVTVADPGGSAASAPSGTSCALEVRDPGDAVVWRKAIRGAGSGAVILDPGPHTLLFTRPDGSEVERALEIREHVIHEVRLRLR